MSLQAKWLPLERGVDFYIEMLKRLGPSQHHKLVFPPLDSSNKKLKIHIDCWNDFTSFCASKMEPKRSQTRQKTTTTPDLFLQSFVDGLLN